MRPTAHGVNASKRKEYEMRNFCLRHGLYGVALFLSSLAATPATPRESGTAQDFAFIEREVNCLTDIIFREVRGEMVGVWRMVAMVAIARRDDASRRWPKTICGNRDQPRAFSGIDKPLDLSLRDFLVWAQVQQVAEEVYEGAWKTQFLPKGWECVRYFKLSPERIAELKLQDKKRLGITSGTGLWFFEKLERVATLGSISFYKEPRCSPLPTT